MYTLHYISISTSAKVVVLPGICLSFCKQLCVKTIHWISMKIIRDLSLHKWELKFWKSSASGSRRYGNRKRTSIILYSSQSHCSLFITAMATLLDTYSMTVCWWLCTASVHNTATQNSSDNLPSYPQTTTLAKKSSIGRKGLNDTTINK